MLKTVEMSRADKTSGIAVTYRSGSENMFGTKHRCQHTFTTFT